MPNVDDWTSGDDVLAIHDSVETIMGPATGGYYDRDFSQLGIKIYPGGYSATRENVVITTVLGSCISVCLWDPVAQVGGMNHFMLPDSDKPQDVMQGLYGQMAMELLINALMKLGASRRNLQAKVFGGAQMMQQSGSSRHVGGLNLAFVQEYLQTERIAVQAQDVLGRQPRRIAFFPTTGQVLLKRLGQQSAGSVDSYREEESYRQRYSASVKASVEHGGSVELFESSPATGSNKG